MTRRRDFVKTLGAVALGSAVRPRAPSPEPRVPRTLNRIGLELYSVRDAMHKDPDGTLAAVRAMGYTDVELLWSFGNFGRSTEQVRAALDREGAVRRVEPEPRDRTPAGPRVPDCAELHRGDLRHARRLAGVGRSLQYRRGRGASRRHLARFPQRSRPHAADRG